MRDEATAFVPGHVTGFFSAHPAEDPARAGSRGAGLTLSNGVEVTVRPRAAVEGDAGNERAGRGLDSSGGPAAGVVVLDGERVRMAPAARVLDALGVANVARVEATTDLAVGAGFGVSGAVALGTALAANRAFERARSENELVTIAHRAEVRSGTGLGDVVAQARGGVPVRLEPGAPGHGRLDGIPDRTRVEYVTFGGLSTEAVLSGDTETLTAAGERALAHLRADPTLSTFAAASRQFAREADLLVPEVHEAVEAVTDAGGEASMAMLGRTVFALGTGLSDAGYDAEACRTHPAGATLLSE